MVISFQGFNFNLYDYALIQICIIFVMKLEVVNYERA